MDQALSRARTLHRRAQGTPALAAQFEPIVPWLKWMRPFESAGAELAWDVREVLAMEPTAAARLLSASRSAADFAETGAADSGRAVVAPWPATGDVGRDAVAIRRRTGLHPRRAAWFQTALGEPSASGPDRAAIHAWIAAGPTDSPLPSSEAEAQRLRDWLQGTGRVTFATQPFLVRSSLRFLGLAARERSSAVLAQVMEIMCANGPVVRSEVTAEDLDAALASLDDSRP